MTESELELKPSEVCKAVEYYLNNVMFKRTIEVVGIIASTDSASSPRDVFRVRLAIKFVDTEPELPF